MSGITFEATHPETGKVHRWEWCGVPSGTLEPRHSLVRDLGPVGGEEKVFPDLGEGVLVHLTDEWKGFPARLASLEKRLVALEKAGERRVDEVTTTIEGWDKRKPLEGTVNTPRGDAGGSDRGPVWIITEDDRQKYGIPQDCTEGCGSFKEECDGGRCGVWVRKPGGPWMQAWKLSGDAGEFRIASQPYVEFHAVSGGEGGENVMVSKRESVSPRPRPALAEYRDPDKARDVVEAAVKVAGEATPYVIPGMAHGTVRVSRVLVNVVMLKESWESFARARDAYLRSQGGE